MRVFICYELARADANRLQSIVAPHNSNYVKIVGARELHVTLGFIGEVSQKQLTALLNVVNSLGEFDSSSCRSVAVLAVPKYRPHHIVVDLKPDRAFSELRNHLLKQVRALHLSFKYSPPHITIGHIKPDASFKVTDTGAIVGQVPFFELTRVSLCATEVAGSGVKYRRLATKSLKPVVKFRSNVAMCVVNPRSEILLVEHREHKRGAWQFPQGGIDSGETIISTIRKELREELGITKYTLALVKERAYRYHWPKRLQKQGSDESKRAFGGQEQTIAIIRVSEVRPKLKPDPREAARTMWVPINKLVTTLSRVRQPLGRLVMVELQRSLAKSPQVQK